ncbi:MAG: hypothetical protein P9M05_02185 [Candidatus Stygibacter australis]|nr:hypothetical protein [Candidatus Stygibacter australis]
MQKFESILDNDEQLKELGWEAAYHQAIHFPEQVLQARNLTSGIKKYSRHPEKIFIWQSGIENKLLIQLINHIYGDIIPINKLDEIPNIWDSKDGLLIIPDFHQKLKKVPNDDSIIYLTGKELLHKYQNTICYSFPQIPSNEGLGIFLGFISGFLDELSGIDKSNIINKIVAVGMQKAGVLAWRQPYKRNFAKIWAARLAEADNWQISSTQPDFEIICQYWQNKLENWSGINSAVGQQIFLEKMYPTESSSNLEKGSESIFADGVDLVSQIISQYYFINCLAIYISIIKKINYQEILK